MRVTGGLRQNPQRRLDDHAEQTFRSRDDTEQIEPARSRRLAAEPQARAPREHDFRAEKIVGGEPVFEAMQAARILRHIATDGARCLAGWIGRVIKALRRDRAGDCEIGDARLGDHAGILVINLEDAVHPPEADEDRVATRQRAARKRGARPARNDRNTIPARRRRAVGKPVPWSWAARRPGAFWR